jgi:1,4-alpha-glucan branching enzyme
MIRHLTLLGFLATAASVLAGDAIATTFTYADPKARTVEVAGEFSNWKTLPMAKDTSGNWTRTLQLPAGWYGYKLIVDGDWKLDPKNPARKFVNDIEDSVVNVGNVPEPAQESAGPVTLTFTEPQAKTVQVAGDFNRWLDNVEGKVTGKTEWMMQRETAGHWKYVLTLPPGSYRFKYVIDGGERWAQDPNFPASADGNSILEIKATNGRTSTLFTYTDPSARSVFVAGQFNNWSPTANPLKRNDAGPWSVTIPLKTGKQPYKFVVDGEWRTDPANPDSVTDAEGNVNSVKTVAP